MSAAIALLIAYGLAVGLSLGLTGGGGSIITVPLLVYLVGEPVHTAISTSLVIVGGVALIGYLQRIREADSLAGFTVGVAGFLGAVPGRYAALYFEGRVLLLCFAAIMLIASVAMFRSKSYERPALAKHSWPAIIGAGIGIGFLTGFLAVGGGFLIVPALVLLLGIPMRTAIPTSLLVIAMNCAISLVSSMFFQHAAHAAAAVIDWKVCIIFLFGGVAGTVAGAALARKLNARALKRTFAVFVFMVGVVVAGSATGVIPLTVK